MTIMPSKSARFEPPPAKPHHNPQDHVNKGAGSRDTQVASTSKPRKAAEPGHGEKIAHPPVSAFSEPSEPSQGAPGESPTKQLTGSQEENPQLVAGRDKSKL
ncbi:hypothetical protein HWV62_15000 [Athelia sp. TMB]|nr:hypothetical protein HWV62_15000 [Athelia sp. TMB]